jgi:hypothetical protein
MQWYVGTVVDVCGSALYRKSWCDMSDIRAIKLSEIDMSDNERDNTQPYTAWLKRDIFERDIGRDMRDNERDDTPAIHSVSQTWRFQPNFTGTGSYICQAIKFCLAWFWLYNMAPHLGRKLRNAMTFLQTSKITYQCTHTKIARNAIKSGQKYKASF